MIQMTVTRIRTDKLKYQLNYHQKTCSFCKGWTRPQGRTDKRIACGTAKWLTRRLEENLGTYVPEKISPHRW